MKRIIMLLALALLMTGCATMYNEPSAISSCATLRGKPMKGFGATLSNFKEAYIYEINGKSVRNMWKSYGAKRRIPAGKTSVILVHGWWNLSLAPCPKP